jgi:hypothetical protein
MNPSIHPVSLPISIGCKLVLSTLKAQCSDIHYRETVSHNKPILGSKLESFTCLDLFMDEGAIEVEVGVEAS